MVDSRSKSGSDLKIAEGAGAHDSVYVGKLRGRKVAISEFREHLSEMDIRELKLLAEFSHPNIVKFVSRFYLKRMEKRQN